MENSRVATLCTKNLIAFYGIQNIEDMVKVEGQAPWGNSYHFLHMRVPKMGKVENLSEFVRLEMSMMVHTVESGQMD